MKTATIQAHYTLDDATYRARVAAATGPVQREIYVEIPIAEITPEARIALLVIPDRLLGYGVLADQQLARIGDLGHRSDEPTAADVSLAILGLQADQVARAAEKRALDAERSAKDAAERKEHERLVGAWLDEVERDPANAIAMEAKKQDWIRYGISRDGYQCPDIYHPRLRALVARVEAGAAALREEHAQREREHEIEARQWASEHGSALSPELQRAAREDRVVLPEIRRLVGDRFSHALVMTIGRNRWLARATYGSEERTDVPTAAAYALADACTAAIPDLALAAVVPGAAITVGPISRFDVSPSRSDEVWRTGVRISVTHPWVNLSRVVLSEDPAIDESDDDQE